ncbi:MAG: hypothetical protein ABIV51_00485 [Saprospiraceae bacterium]
MKKRASLNPFWISVILIALLAGLVSPFGPWWIFSLLCIVGGFIAWPKGIKRFWLGFLAIFILWFLVALVLDIGNKSNLSSKIGQLFGGLPSIALLLVSALIGGIVGGLSTMFGSYIKDLMKQKS